jgi:NADH-quinone oxidoreductase subunit N
MTLGTFALVALFEHRAEEQMTMDSLKGLANRFPGLALALTVLLLSLAGIPPLLGFFGKFHLFASALDQDLVWLAIWGVVGSVISVYYYLRPIVLMYMVEGEGVDPIEDSQMSQVAVLFAAVLVVLFGIYSSPVLSAVQRSMAALL